MTATQEMALDATTVLAAYLNSAMQSDTTARARYLAIYGEEWSALGCGASISDAASTSANTAR